jgi:hypothetical protein
MLNQTALQVRPASSPFLEFLSPFFESFAHGGESVENLWELEGRLAIALALFDYVHEVDSKWSESILESGDKPRLEDAIAIEALYRGWLEAASSIRNTITNFEEREFFVENAARFRYACDTADLKLAFDAVRTFKAVQQVDSGKVRPWKEAAHAVQTNPDRRGQ